MASKAKLAPVVSVLNMKGGVGKTTISAHVFRLLYRHLKRSTLLVDFDPQFNLTQTIVPQATYETLKLSRRTILSVMEPEPSESIFKVNDALGPPPKWPEVAHGIFQLEGHPNVNIHMIPGDFGLVKYSLIEDVNSLVPTRDRFLTFIDETRHSRDLICIDCNPSSSFMTLCAVLASTHILVPVRPDRYSLLGLELLDKFIDGVPQLTKKPEIIVILNGVPKSGYDPTVENSLRSHPKFGPATMLTSLYTSKLLEASHNYTGFATDKKVPHRLALTNRITAVVEELGKRLGL